MERCPICIDGKVSVKLSSHGEEIFCMACRGIVKSATLGFIFEASGDEGVEPCRAADGRNGLKGPGKRARCYAYDDGDEQGKKKAEEKARASAYAHQHKRVASKIINSVANFTGAPASMMPPPANTVSTKSVDYAAQANPAPKSLATDLSKTTPATGGSLNSMVPSAPGGVQIGDLNKSNPLNSGTTASTRLAELIADDQALISGGEMGIPLCTKHNMRHICNLDDNLL